MDVLLDLAGDRVGGGQVALPTLAGAGEAAVPASLLAVLLPVDGHGDAIRQRRDVDELGLGAERARPIVVAARLRRADLLGRLIRIEVADARIGLDVLGGIIVERLAR